MATATPPTATVVGVDIFGPATPNPKKMIAFHVTFLEWCRRASTRLSKARNFNWLTARRLASGRRAPTRQAAKATAHCSRCATLTRPLTSSVCAARNSAIRSRRRCASCRSALIRMATSSAFTSESDAYSGCVARAPADGSPNAIERRPWRGAWRRNRTEMNQRLYSRHLTSWRGDEPGPLGTP